MTNTKIYNMSVAKLYPMHITKEIENYGGKHDKTSK